MPRPMREIWAGYVPIMCLGIGAGAGAWFAQAVGALELPLALLGAAGGYVLSAAVLKRIYAGRE